MTCNPETLGINGRVGSFSHLATAGSQGAGVASRYAWNVDRTSGSDKLRLVIRCSEGAFRDLQELLSANFDLSTAPMAITQPRMAAMTPGI